MKILVFAASHRPQSTNRQLALLSREWLTRHHQQVDFAEYAELDIPLYNAHESETGHIPDVVSVVAARVAQADAVIIAAPEYNWSIPGSLKNLIDWLSYLRPCPLAGKTALLMCATPSKRGGAVGLSHLKTALESVGVFVYPSAFTCGEAGQMLGDAGFTQSKMQQQFDVLHTQFVDFAGRLHKDAA